MDFDSLKQSIFDLTLFDIQKIVFMMGEPEYRVHQIWQGIYIDLFSRWDQFTILPKKIRHDLAERFVIHTLKPIRTISSDDKTTEKTLFHDFKGNPIETVLMHEDKRVTICVSSQSGCAIGCVFCATGKLGLLKNLTKGEIIEQIIYIARKLKQQGLRITNVVFMGMGEPFNNYTSLITAINTIRDKKGLNLGSRRLTVSTIGIIPKIHKFAIDEPQVNLAISLHSPNDMLRNSLIPINMKYPINELINECRAYTSNTHRRITFEYVLLKGVNDTLDHANQLSELLRNMLCHINLIPLNPIQSFHQKPPDPESLLLFYKYLVKNNIPVTIRKSMGTDIHAACGQLIGYN